MIKQLTFAVVFTVDRRLSVFVSHTEGNIVCDSSRAIDRRLLCWSLGITQRQRRQRRQRQRQRQQRAGQWRRWDTEDTAANDGEFSLSDATPSGIVV